jgi:hypothetical protein
VARVDELVAWAERYVRHRDLFEKRIASLEQQEDQLLIKHKDGSSLRCFVADALDDDILAAAAKEEKALIVTRNLKANLDFLVKHWHRFAERAGLKLVFANVQHHEKWVLVPASHESVADPESLATGLQALFETVPEG